MSLDVRVGVDSECINTTHNHRLMAQEARLYNYLWHAGPTPRARKVAAVIRRALKDIERFPLAYKRLEATNGHGTVDEFIQFLKEVEHECRANPNKRLYSFG